MVKTFSAGGVVINNLNQVIVVDQDGDSWSLPKGHIDEGETPLDAAKREVLEESGVSDLEFVTELGSYTRYRHKHGKIDKTTLKHITMFLFKTKEQKLHPMDPENPEARWVDKEDVSKLLSFAEDKKFFENLLQKELL
jgi:ADP-ribose pyrophosphatase YjhB (NUDIX family)